MQVIKLFLHDVSRGTSGVLVNLTLSDCLVFGLFFHDIY